MTATPPAHLRLTAVDEGTVRIELHGDLDYDNADRLLDTVTGQLAAHPRLEHLHLDCGGLGVVDSMGLSVLLMIHRRTSGAGVHLHLDHRSAQLDRLLAVTGTMDHLTAPESGATGPSDTTGEDAGQARSARPDGST